MSDLIDRQAAIDAFEDTTYTKNEIRRRITELPSVQPDIVACGDCIHQICHDRRCGYGITGYSRWIGAVMEKG